MFELLEAGLLSGAEAALNRLLALDPASPAKLRDLAGARVQLESTRPRLCVCVLVHESGVLLRQGSRSLMMDLDEYLHEERRLFPGRNEVEAFQASLQELRLDLDRLAARVERLDRKIPG